MEKTSFRKLKLNVLIVGIVASAVLIFGVAGFFIYGTALSGQNNAMKVKLFDDLDATYSFSAIKATCGGESVRVGKESAEDMISLLMQSEPLQMKGSVPDFSADTMRCEFASGSTLCVMAYDAGSVECLYTLRDGTEYHFRTNEYCSFDKISRFGTLRAYKPGNEPWE